MSYNFAVRPLGVVLLPLMAAHVVEKQVYFRQARKIFYTQPVRRKEKGKNKCEKSQQELRGVGVSAAACGEKQSVRSVPGSVVCEICGACDLGTRIFPHGGESDLE